MSTLFQTHFMFLKKRPFALLFWMLLPLAVTIIFMKVADVSESEVRIPIAIVVHDDSALAKTLENSILSNDMLNVSVSGEDKALRNLRKHEYDSVFIIPSDFSTRLTNGETKDLIQAYRSDRTLFFEPIKEMVISHVQSAAGRVKAANTVQLLSEQILDEQHWSKEEIIKTANTIEQKQHLLYTVFSFAGEANQRKDSQIVSPWFPWSCAALLSAFFIYDWIIREGQQPAFSRLAFMRYGNVAYLLCGALLYTLLLIIMDFASVAFFQLFYSTDFNIKFLIALLFYRLVINGLAFIIGGLLRNTYVYYCIGLIISLLALITSGLFIKSDFVQTIFTLNPVHLFANEQISIFWTLLLLIVIPLVLRYRKEHSDA